MGIHDEDIARTRAAVDLVAIIGEHTEIKRSGRNWMARCPIHGERTPSLSVSPEKGVYYCFGCGASGDAITFVQEMESLDFVGAVESLAGRYGVQLRYTSAGEGQRRGRKKGLQEAVGKAVDFYHERLLSGQDSAEARAYLRSRGYNGELVRRYQIGWAPDDWDQLARHVRLSADDLRDSGLGFVNKAGRQQDAFRGRVMFPIHDERGEPVGFGGRILPGHEGPKYKNTTTEAEVYDKSKVLYGLHTHRDGIVKAGEAIICEGYTDVIGYATAGILRAVATCGTALTEEHVRLLKRFSANRLVLSFDADAAGLAAAERVYAWEKEYELDIRVAALPPGIDPDDLARQDPEGLHRAVDEAVPFLKFRLDRVLDAGDMSTPEGKARAAEAALDVVREHPDTLVRDQYVIEIADHTRIELARLRELLAAERRPRPAAQQSTRYPEPRYAEPEPNWDDYDPGVDPDGPPKFDLNRLTPEDEAIRLMIHRPDEVAGRLVAALFGDPVRREAFVSLESEGVMAAADRVGGRAATLLRRLAVEASEADADDVVAGVVRLAADRVVRDLQLDARHASSVEDRHGFAQAIAWVKTQSEQLSERSTREAAVDQLLPWLNQHAEGRGA
ncbi:MAG: DNA primase [Acidimicrobiaceae bacterium]|nr:DNA primase [Acidimicrobiaceae bacterium]HAB57644.1 DNA primase [Acidimicrobiaceae bacterium]